MGKCSVRWTTVAASAINVLDLHGEEEAEIEGKSRLAVSTGVHSLTYWPRPLGSDGTERQHQKVPVAKMKFLKKAAGDIRKRLEQRPDEAVWAAGQNPIHLIFGVFTTYPT